MNWFRRWVRAVQIVRADKTRRRKLAAVLGANPTLTPPTDDAGIHWLLNPGNPDSPLNPAHPNHAATDAAIHAPPATQPLGHHDVAATQPTHHHDVGSHPVGHADTPFGGGFDAGGSHGHH